MREFNREAKRHGLLYVGIRDRKNPEHCEIMVFAAPFSLLFPFLLLLFLFPIPLPPAAAVPSPRTVSQYGHSIREWILQPKKQEWKKAGEQGQKRKLHGLQALYYSYLYQMGVLKKPQYGHTAVSLYAGALILP